MLAAWFQVFSVSAHAAVEALASELRSCGIELDPSLSARLEGPGLVVLEECSEDVLSFVRRASRCGASDRILAVVLARETPKGASWSLLHSGAGDVITWSGSKQTARQIAARLERWHDIAETLRSSVRELLVGSSPVWNSAMRRLVELAKFTEAPVLIEGESGTGKELAARLIHRLDARANKPDLVVLDCTTIVPELSGSEFFGHDRGAYTGATGARDGAFALADGGTLFLDEVGELPPVLQAQLLRVIQEKTYKRVGGNTWQSTCFRLVCATNRDLLAEVERGHFRRDLYYRIASATCRLPPLRERREDIIPLAKHFLSSALSWGRRSTREALAGAPAEGDAPELDRDLIDYLEVRNYPGNVRDLRQLVTRMLYRHVGNGPFTVGDLPCDDRPECGDQPVDWREGALEGAVRHAISLGVGLKAIGKAAEDLAVRVAVEQEAGNLQRAAQRLGVTDRALQLRRATRNSWSD